MFRDTYAVIDLDALDHNLNLITKEIGLDQIYAVVKANAYGHDLITFSKLLYERGIRHFAVACVKEAYHLYQDAREIFSGGKVLIMGHTSDRLLSEFREYPFIFTIFSIEQGIILNDAARKVDVEIKVNTGFNRLGKRPTEAFIKEVKAIHALKNISIHGVFSHLRLAEHEEDLRQIAEYEKFCRSLPFKNYLRHICDSIAFIQYPQARFDMVRLGAILYGLVPDRQLYLGYRPTLSLHSEVAHVMNIQQGEGISYDEQFRAHEEMTIATIPIGYGDGYKRSLSNQGMVFVHDRLCPIVSTICMDQLMIDITDMNVKVGDTVELIGSNIPVRQVAAFAGTNRNDIISSLSARIERRYVKNNETFRII